MPSLALSTDLYQLTMAAGYFHRGFAGRAATCELFVRRLPAARRFLVALGIDRLLDALTSLAFDEEDIAFLRSVPALEHAMTPAFCDYLRAFRFTGDVAAVEEGTVVFANEPLLRVRAPIIEAQILETLALSIINHATMIGSKAARVVLAAKGRACVEFGTRRTHPEAAIDAARAAYAAGFAGTSNVEASRRYGIPVLGTAAHMWTMAHPSEEASFEGYFAVFPSSSILLIDTYDTPRGALRAARVARDKLAGVRIDSGDLAALSMQVRAILDAEGAPQAKIVASGDLNERIIEELLLAGAPIDTFGVGTELVCSVDAPSLGGVYKLVAIDDGEGSGDRPIAKFSEGKATMPGAHQVVRFSEGGVFARDVIMLESEAEAAVGGGGEALLSSALVRGARARGAAPIQAVRGRVAAQLAALPEPQRRLDPGRRSDGTLVAPYPVETSAALRALTEELRASLVKAEV